MSPLPSVTLLKSQIDRQGGLEKYAWEIARAFCDAGASVTLLTTGQVKPPFISELLKIVSFPIQYPLSYLNVMAFDRSCENYLKYHPTPVVFSLDRNSMQTHLRAGNGAHLAYLRRRAREEGKWKAFTFQCNPLHSLILKIEKRSFESPHLKKLFTNSHMVKQEIIDLYATPSDKIEVVHNGVEWSQMLSDFQQWQEKREQLLSSLQLDPNAYQLLFVGHNYRRKGLEFLLRGMSLLKDPVQLCIIGKESHLSSFRQMAHQLKLDHAVRFLGERADTRSFYQMADALVIPSSYDPFANVTVEALAMGLYVVSSTTNGGHEVLQPFSGTTIDQISDPDAVAQALKRALSHRKTDQSSLKIRESVAHLDFPHQLKRIVHATLLS
jgi:UDP-glucose:(heptosyl)LPS alpha-1,3-glucosyltransferase